MVIEEIKELAFGDFENKFKSHIVTGIKEALINQNNLTMAELDLLFELIPGGNTISVKPG